MKRLSVLAIILMGALLFVGAKVQAYSWVYNNVTWDFTLTGFSNQGTPSAGPLNLEITNIQNFTLPNPPAGTYDWYLEVYNFALDVTQLHPGDDITLSNLGPFYLGTANAPLPTSGSLNLGDIYVPSHTFSYGPYSFTVGGYLVQNVTVSWALYEDTNGQDLAEPGDAILYAVFGLSADNLDQTINQDLTYLDNSIGGANGIIDGSGSADFKVSAAVPEPATLLLVGSGLFFLGKTSRRRKK